MIENQSSSSGSSNIDAYQDSVPNSTVRKLHKLQYIASLRVKKKAKEEIMKLLEDGLFTEAKNKAIENEFSLEFQAEISK